jgi:hypothetical protein
MRKAPETRRVCYGYAMDVMSLCNVHALPTWAAVGGGDGYGIPASSATVHRRIVDDRA